MPDKLYSQIDWNTGTLQSASNLDECKLGTETDFPIRFFIDAAERMRLSAMNGYLGIGNTSCSSLLSVGNTEGFQVDDAGNIIEIHGITYSFPNTQATLYGYVLQNDGSGILEWVDPNGLITTSWKRNGNSTTTSDFIGTINAQDLAFRTVNTERMRLSATNGYLGIGNTSCSSLLTVGSTEGFQINNSGNITKINGIDYSFPSIQASVGYILQNNGSGTLTWIDPSTLVTSNAWDLTGNASTNPTNDFIGTTDAIDFVFRTNNVEKMRILSDGNVGIGIQTPQSTLHIHSDEESGTTNTNPNGGGGSTRGQINLQQNNAINSFQITNKISGKTENDGLFLSLYNKDIVLENKETGYIKFETTKMGLCVFPDGNVGIGTTQGDAKLNIIAAKEDGIFIRLINSPTNKAVSVLTNKITTKSFVSSYGKTENFIVYGNGETQIMNGINKLYFGDATSIGDPAWPTSYMGFNASFNGTDWICETNNYNNGGAVIWSTVGGGICFSNFETDGNSAQQLTASNLVDNRTMMIHSNGSVSIGGYHTDNGNYKLAVYGTIAARKVIANQNNWYDHVFAEDYNLMSIEDLSIYIKENQHLPEIPAQEDVDNKGVDLGEMNAKLLLKVEELTLYIIELNQRIEKLENEK